LIHACSVSAGRTPGTAGCNPVRMGVQSVGSVRTPKPVGWNSGSNGVSTMNRSSNQVVLLELHNLPIGTPFKREFNWSVLPGCLRGLVATPFEQVATKVFCLAWGYFCWEDSRDCWLQPCSNGSATGWLCQDSKTCLLELPFEWGSTKWFCQDTRTYQLEPRSNGSSTGQFCLAA
jgi:hypothetical protein